jgi:hypothetical protein
VHNQIYKGQIKRKRPEKNGAFFMETIKITTPKKEQSMSHLVSLDTPAFAVPEANLIPVSDHLTSMSTIPPSRMFLIKKSLKVFREKYPDKPIYDASQGDGGASLPGVPRELLERALQLQLEHALWLRWVSPLCS